MSNKVKNVFLEILKSESKTTDGDINILLDEIGLSEYSENFNEPVMADILKHFFKGYISTQRYRIINKDISIYDVFNIQEYSIQNIEKISKEETLNLYSNNLHTYLFLIGYYEKKDKGNVLHDLIVEFFDIILS
jgi:hypothetical protein